MQIGPQPPDAVVISALLASVDRFEDAVKIGKNFIAAMSAHSVLSIYIRFFPTAMDLVCSEQRESQLRPPDFVSNPLIPDSPPPLDKVSKRKYRYICRYLVRFWYGRWPQARQWRGAVSDSNHPLTPLLENVIGGGVCGELIHWLGNQNATLM